MPVTELDRVIENLSSIDLLVHNPARLMILFALVQSSPIDYLKLMSLTNLTWGNISTHLSKLEDAGYVKILKSFMGKKPHTAIKITSRGRNAYLKWGFAIASAVPGIALTSLHDVDLYPSSLEDLRKSIGINDAINHLKAQELFFVPVYHTWGIELPPLPQYN